VSGHEYGECAIFRGIPVPLAGIAGAGKAKRGEKAGYNYVDLCAHILSGFKTSSCKKNYQVFFTW
jgi:hypothetical protein